MSIEDKIKEVKKLEKKKKWDTASKSYVEIADYYLESKDFTKGLDFLESAIAAQQREKKAEQVIILYRKIISAAKKGKSKTKKELFRYAAAAIPLVEEYIQVLKESKGNRYISKHGAMTRYFLGECREIVSGEAERNKEFLRAGNIFVKVAKDLFSSPKTEPDANEAFQKARIIFDLMNNREETFKALLVEAEINIRKYRLERGFALFDEARAIFDDDSHQKMSVDIEKVVYAEIGLKLLRNHFSDIEQHQIAEMLISKSREAHLLANSLDKVPEILFEIGKINIDNKQLENGFSSFDEAITNSQLVGDKETQGKIIEYLFDEGKKIAENIQRPPTKLESLIEVDKLPFMVYFNKLEEICRKLDRNQEVEEVAQYIWQLGLTLLESNAISDDSYYIKRAFALLINNNRFDGLQKIADELEKRLDEFTEKKQLDQLQELKTLLVDSYERIDDYPSASFLNVKVAQTYASWGNYEKQVECLREAASLLQTADTDTVKAFSKSLDEQFEKMEAYVPDSILNEVLQLVGNTYLQLRDDDKYDSLYARFALKSIETNDFTKVMAYHQQDYEFLRSTKNFSRAIARLDEVSKNLFAKGQYQLANNLRSKQTKLLIETNSSQEQVLPLIESLENQITEILTQKADVELVNDLFNHLIKLYDYLGLKEAQGDAMVEMANKLIEVEYFDSGFEYLNRAFEKFKAENVVEKYALLLDFALEKKVFYESLENQKIAGRFLDFLIRTLTELDQKKEAADLILSRAIQLIPIDEVKASDHFEQAKKLISQTSSSDDLMSYYQDYGSALLKKGKIDQGMETLAQAESSTSTKSLAIADTCLTVARDSFADKDYDTYFILVDRAMSIYTDLEMFQESSSIALAEARKLWSVNNLPYSMIFLERAWAPLSVTYDEKLTQSIQPLLEVAEEFISALFEQGRYDEAKNFLEFQERIYKQLNLTDKILEVEMRKIDALIGRGNIEGALSHVYDIASIGIEESKFKDTIALLRELLPTFVRLAPQKTKFLLKIFINLLVTMEPKEVARRLVHETLDFYTVLIAESATEEEHDLFQNQTTLFFEALAEVAEAEDELIFFTIRFSQELIAQGAFSFLFPVLKLNLVNLQPSKPETKMRIINGISSFLKKTDFNEQFVQNGLDFINGLSLNFDDKNKEILTGILLDIGQTYKKQKEIYEYSTQLAFQQSTQITDTSVALNILYRLIEEDLGSKNYLNALKGLDYIIDKLDHAPEIMADQFVQLLDKFLSGLSRGEKKKWMDLFKAKQELINEKILHKGD